MDTILFTNILFVAITLFLIFITVTFTILLIYIILVFKHINAFLKAIKKESEKIAQDIDNVRGKIKDGEDMLVSFVTGIMSFFKNSRKKSKKNNN